MPSYDRERLGRYEILAELGQGAMGKVYRARDPKIDRLVAIKTISVPDSQPAGEDFRERFFREARAAGRLSHPGIVTIFDVEDDADSGPFIVMEYVAGKTLDQMFSPESQRFSASVAIDLAGQIAEALHYAHSQGIVHRDIKPANIIVTPEGRAKITDFGIAKLDMTQFTATGQVFGTPSFMSPEQIEGEEVDGRSDLFSLGVVLYSMLTGYRPFQGNSAATISYKLVYKDPVPVSALNSSLPVHLDYVVSRALAKVPDFRYQSGAEMALDLRDIKDGVPPRSAQTAPASPAADKTRVHSTVGSGWKSHLLGAKRPGRLRRAYAILQGRNLWLTGLVAALLITGAVTYKLYRGMLASTKPTEPSAVSSVPASPAQQPLPATLNTPPASPSSPAVVPVKKLSSVTPRESAAKSPVELAVESPFESATLEIWVDGKLTYQHDLSGQTKKKLWVVKSAESDLSGTMSVPAGKHWLRVQLSSEKDHYFGVGRVQGEFVAHEPKLLNVTFHGHEHQMMVGLK